MGTISSQNLLAERLQKVPPYPFAAIAKRVRGLVEQGHDVIQLDIGSPDLPPPPQVIQALCAAATNPKAHGYGGFAGTPLLRQSFANYYQRRFGVKLDVDREVLPLLGSKEGIVNINLALINPGDVVLVPDPGYIAYSRGVILAGGEPYMVPLDPDQNYQPAIDSIPADVLKRARMMWVNYPNNPTGAVASRDELTRIVEFCRHHGIILCSDNPYADVTFDGVYVPSILEIDGAKEIAVEFNSVSKTYNMAGWRIGVCVGNPQIVDALLRVKSNIDSGLFQVTQDACCVALTDVSAEWIQDRNRVYERRRDLLMANLERIGLSGVPPRGGLYVWAAVQHGDDVQYAHQALDEALVSVSAGSMYGPSGSGFIRISLVVDETRLADAIERLARWQETKRTQ